MNSTFIMPAKHAPAWGKPEAGIQENSLKALDSSFRWHDGQAEVALIQGLLNNKTTQRGWS